MTKTTTHCAMLLSFLFMLQSFCLIGQPEDLDPIIETNSLVVIYEPNITFSQVQQARTSYNVTDYEHIYLGGQRVDIWEIEFPHTFPNGTVAYSIIDFNDMVNINPGGNDESSDDTIINSVNLNYLVNFENTGQEIKDDTYTDPVPICPSQLFRVANDDFPSTNSKTIDIVVFDQLIYDTDHFSSLNPNHRISIVPSTSAATHGTEVTSVIQYALEAANVTNYRLISLGVFDDNGSASLASILKAFKKLYNLGIENAIINMSASVLISDAGKSSLSYVNTFWDIIGEYLEHRNNLFISSGSNSGTVYTSNIFFDENGDIYLDLEQEPEPTLTYPGCAGMANEITVVGLSNCFTEIASFSGAHATHFEIGAEAEDILIWDGDDQLLGNGVSYATPLVTAAAAQIALYSGNFSPQYIKNSLLDHADVEHSLIGLIQNGKVLNVTASLEAAGSPDLLRAPSDNPYGMNIEAEKQGTNIAVSPNPFHEELNIDLTGFSNQTPVTVKLYDMNGQMVLQKEMIGGNTFNWAIPANLPAGSYALSIQSSDKMFSHRVLKL